TASLQIDRQNPNILSFKDVYQIETEQDDELRTQVEVLKSRTLARRVIENLKLDRNEEFQQEPGVSSAISAYVREITSPKRTNTKEPDALSPIVNTYQDRLDVTPVRQARLVNISFTSKDAELAARVINTHARQFIDQNLQFKVEATEAASDFLQQNL